VDSFRGIFAPFMEFPNRATQGGGAYQRGGSSQDEMVAKVIAEYSSIPSEKVFLPYLLTPEETAAGVDSYKPSVSAVISSCIEALTNTDDLATHLTKIMKVIDAWEIDAFETNIYDIYNIASAKLYKSIDDHADGKIDITQLYRDFAYIILVDNGISTLLPSLHPTKEVLRLIAAIDYINRAPPAATSRNRLRLLTAAAALERRETQKNLPPITNRNLRPIGPSIAQKLPLEGVPLANRFKTLANLPQGASENLSSFVMVPASTRGGARRTRRNRRRTTRRQATKTAAHRRRTIRKRK
jgi:hypothetical protein